MAAAPMHPSARRQIRSDCRRTGRTRRRIVPQAAPRTHPLLLQARKHSRSRRQSACANDPLRVSSSRSLQTRACTRSSQSCCRTGHRFGTRGTTRRCSRRHATVGCTGTGRSPHRMRHVASCIRRRTCAGRSEGQTTAAHTRTRACADCTSRARRNRPRTRRTSSRLPPIQLRTCTVPSSTRSCHARSHAAHPHRARTAKAPLARCRPRACPAARAGHSLHSLAGRRL